MARHVVILSGIRTAIGDYGGSLKDTPATKLAGLCLRESIRRSGVANESVGHVVFGTVLLSEPRDLYLSRVAAIEGGLPIATPAMNVNRLCASGLQAIVSATQTILLGDADCAVAGGVETMSRGAYLLPNLRWGARFGDGATTDLVFGGLIDPFGHGHMGITAENIAAKLGFSREDQDAYAVESHRRAAKAQVEGRFVDQILPIELPTRGGTKTFAVDEHVRAETSLADLAKLKAAFKKDGTVTAGNASSLNDAAAAVVLMEEGAASQAGHAPLGRIVSYAHSGVEPEVMGLGPIPAVRKALDKAGLKVADLDVIESNEAFAVQACAVAREMDFPPERVNPNGGAVALGHPVGATGAIIFVKALYELRRTGGRYGLITMCIGGGQGIAVIIERL